MKIVVPLAGPDDLIKEIGYPKVLCPVLGKTLIEIISESRPYSFNNALFILNRDYNTKYKIDKTLRYLFGERIKIVTLKDFTEGAPQSVLCAKENINMDEELIIDLLDQYLDLFGFHEFIQNNGDIDGIIPTFESLYEFRGYMQYDACGFVKEVAEKKRISTHSTACISYFQKGRDFINAAEVMVKNKNTAVNNMYYISLVYNEMIKMNKKILPFSCEFIGTLGNKDAINTFEQYIRPIREN